MMKKTFLIGVIGYPGSGKTYFSERLSKEFGLFHLNSDQVRLNMFETPTYSLEESVVLFRFMNFLTEKLLQSGCGVIFDANSTKKKHRRKFETMAEGVGAEYILVWIKTDVETAKNRLSRSPGEDEQLYRNVDESVFEEIKDGLENPDESESCIEIDGTASFEDQLQFFKHQVKL